MDLFDLGSSYPPDLPHRRRTVGEDITFFLSWCVFPVLNFFLVADVAGANALLGVWLAPLSAVAIYLIARRVKARTSVTVISVVMCLGCSFLAGVLGTVSATF